MLADSPAVLYSLLISLAAALAALAGVIYTARVNRRHNDSTDANDTTRTIIAGLQALIDEQHDELDRLKARVAELETETLQLRQQVRDTRQHAYECERDLRTNREDLRVARDRIAALERKVEGE